uniref:Uncharacterized protein n=1 Tax=Caenorhabditis japonica TaxID=281687 RepID=A0A8R1ENE3_CAEJA
GAKKKEFSPGDAVFVKDYRSKVTWIPGHVVARFGKVMYRVECNGQLWDRHANQLRRRDHQIPTSSPLLEMFDLPSQTSHSNPPPICSPHLPLQHLPQSSPHRQALPNSSPARPLSSNVDRQSKPMDSLSSIDLPSPQMDLSSSDALSLDDVFLLESAE